MRKLIIVLILFVLVGCHSEAKMDETQEALFQTALKELEDAKAISLSLINRRDTTYLDKEGKETETTTSYIAYRYHDLLVDTQYVNEESEIFAQDFDQKNETNIITLHDRMHQNSSEALSEDTGFEDLEALNIYFLEILDDVAYEDVTVTHKKDQSIYTINGSATNYVPLVNIKNAFEFIDAKDYTLSEYTFVLENDSIKNVTLIYSATDDTLEHIVNVSMDIHALNDDVVIPYLDLMDPE